MKNVFTYIIATMLIAGCAQKTWVKAGATEDAFRRDHMTCRQYGMQSAMANGMAGNTFVEIWIQDETAKCLNNLGYSQVEASSISKAPVTNRNDRSFLGEQPKDDRSFLSSDPKDW